MDRVLDPSQKAFEINLDHSIYGTFAEIGAGQEVARYFFRAGGAAGTIAKSMSAYDMTVSDDIYGKSGRYVSRERLRRMLEKEMEQLTERLSKTRGSDTRFFVFADTVAAKSYNYHSYCHGWSGIRFQHSPTSDFSEVVVHVRMRDQSNLQQQEALGILGTNLVYASFYLADDREKFICSLMDNLSTDRIEIDLIEASGPAFDERDPRLWSLELVKRSFCDAIMFDNNGSVLQARDALYKKNVLVCRGSYRPPTLVNIDMLETGSKEFKKVLEDDEIGDVLILPEISMNKLKERGEVIPEDFLARVDLLNTLGHKVLITSYNTFGQLNSYLATCTQLKIAFVMGYFNLEELFDKKSYADRFNGLLGGISDLFSNQSRVFLYPGYDEKEKAVLTSKSLKLDKELRILINYLETSGKFSDIKDFDQSVFSIWSRVVLRMIQTNQEGWEKMVPQIVAKRVKDQCLFDFPCDL